MAVLISFPDTVLQCETNDTRLMYLVACLFSLVLVLVVPTQVEMARLSELTWVAGYILIWFTCH